MADIFTVIADSTRRDILGVLLDRRVGHRTVEHRSDGHGDASVSEIVEALGVPQPTVSKHLRTLRDAGLASVREEGQHRFYAIELSRFDEIDDWLMPFIFAEGEQEQVSLGAAAFAAWAGANVQVPLRAVADQARQAAEQARIAAEQALARVSETVEHPAPVGETLGRRAAEGVHDVQERVQEARDRIHEVQERLQELQSRAVQRIDEAKGRLRRRDEEVDASGEADASGDAGGPTDAVAADDARLD